MQHLFTNIVKLARSKRDSQQTTTHVDHLLFQLIDEIHLIWNSNPLLDRAQELVKEAIDRQAYYNTAELDRSRPVRKEAARIRRFGEQIAVNMHTMGTSFVGKVRVVRQMASELAPNDEENAAITFNTDVAQGIITSPQLFNIFINALLRMLTVTGQNEDISHRLQIGKDQKRDNQ